LDVLGEKWSALCVLGLWVIVEHVVMLSLSHIYSGF
jgi:hypothetical protein